MTQLTNIMQDDILSSSSQYEDDAKLERRAKLRQIKEAIYRFFYNIWPSVKNFLTMVFYHSFRIIRGGIRTALEQLK